MEGRILLKLVSLKYFPVPKVNNLLVRDSIDEYN